MKALLLITALFSVPAFADGFAKANIDGNLKLFFGCREGDTRYFSNDGYCANGMERNTYRVCHGGRYVVVREECVGGH